jgi:polyhydroxybutyrate depolymerase
MMRLLSFAAAVLLAAVFGAARAATDPICGVDGPCAVATGSYRVSPPAGWDGTSPLPAALFFHGWQGSAAAEMADRALRRDFGDAGILLVFPDGAEKTWSHQGSPTQARDDIAFVRSVVADVERRWPVDTRLLWAVGFSQGASMVWDLACRGGGFAAYVAISGAFWEPMPADCPAAPANLLHVHGLVDNTVPLEGRRIGERWQQGDVFRSMAFLRQENGCPTRPDAFERSGDLMCRSWRASCAGGTLELCLHPGSHNLPKGWFPLAWDWVRTVAAAPLVR